VIIVKKRLNFPCFKLKISFLFTLNEKNLIIPQIFNYEGLLVTRLFYSLLILCSVMLASTSEIEGEFNPIKEESLFDPLSGYNEVMTTFNDGMYEYILKPVSQGYAYVVPKPAREGIDNAFENLLFPVRFINNLLQFKFQNSIEELGRFVINSTLGIAGFMDVASSEFGLKKHEEDFGQTLGHYGVGSGFHIVLPFLGPSNVRDIVGLVGDTWASPLSYIEARDANMLDSSEEEWILKGVKGLNFISLHAEEYDALKKDAIELYPFIRNFYESRRTKLIRE